MELLLKASGLQIDSMVMESKRGLMDHIIQVLILQERNMEIMASLFGLITQNMKANLETIILRVKVSTLGLMVALIKGTGEITKCMEKAYLSGPIAEKSTMVNTEMTRNMGMEKLVGLMGENTQGSGQMESSMAQVLM